MYRNWRELIKPKRLEVDEETHSAYYGKFECVPLERGFGITVGNSLRRILISSLQTCQAYIIFTRMIQFPINMLIS